MRVLARRKYLTEREQKMVQELGDFINDEEYIFEEENLTAAEMKQLQLNKKHTNSLLNYFRGLLTLFFSSQLSSFSLSLSQISLCAISWDQIYNSLSFTSINLTFLFFYTYLKCLL